MCVLVSREIRPRGNDSCHSLTGRRRTAAIVAFRLNACLVSDPSATAAKLGAATDRHELTFDAAQSACFINCWAMLVSQSGIVGAKVTT
jgi:hypothetical protein